MELDQLKVTINRLMMKKNTHPIIIELYGLPGCGKTTLRDRFVNNKMEPFSYAMMTELSKKYKSLPFIKKINYIPLRAWWYIVIFIMSLPILRFRDWIFYKVFFEFAIIYNFACHTNGSDYIIVDHGLIQAVVSLTNGHKKKLTDKQLIRLLKVILCFPECMFVYCVVSVSTSIERIHTRNRGHGRLDVIKEKEKLIVALDEEETLFNEIHNCLCSINIISCLELDCEREANECIEQFRHLLKYEQ